MDKIQIGGFQRQTLSDYPGNISSIIFTAGCNFRCGYCHNPELVYPEQIKKADKLDIYKILKWIEKNSLMLDAVVITGGEPTMHGELPELISTIKNMELNVKLDTNGTNPTMLKELVIDKQVDYVAMDIKAPLFLERYQDVVGEKFNEKMWHNVIDSVNILKESSVDYEFRTTAHGSLTFDDFRQISGFLSGKLYIQRLVNSQTNTTTELAKEIACNIPQLNRANLEVVIR